MSGNKTMLARPDLVPWEVAWA